MQKLFAYWVIRSSSSRRSKGGSSWFSAVRHWEKVLSFVWFWFWLVDFIIWLACIVNVQCSAHCSASASALTALFWPCHSTQLQIVVANDFYFSFVVAAVAVVKVGIIWNKWKTICQFSFVKFSWGELLLRETFFWHFMAASWGAWKVAFMKIAQRSRACRKMENAVQPRGPTMGFSCIKLLSKQSQAIR